MNLYIDDISFTGMTNTNIIIYLHYDVKLILICLDYAFELCEYKKIKHLLIIHNNLLDRSIIRNIVILDRFSFLYFLFHCWRGVSFCSWPIIYRVTIYYIFISSLLYSLDRVKLKHLFCFFIYMFVCFVWTTIKILINA